MNERVLVDGEMQDIDLLEFIKENSSRLSLFELRVLGRMIDEEIDKELLYNSDLGEETNEQ